MSQLDETLARWKRETGKVKPSPALMAQLNALAVAQSTAPAAAAGAKTAGGFATKIAIVLIAVVVLGVLGLLLLAREPGALLGRNAQPPPSAEPIRGAPPPQPPSEPIRVDPPPAESAPSAPRPTTNNPAQIDAAPQTDEPPALQAVPARAPNEAPRKPRRSESNKGDGGSM